MGRESTMKTRMGMAKTLLRITGLRTRKRTNMKMRLKTTVNMRLLNLEEASPA